MLNVCGREYGHFGGPMRVGGTKRTGECSVGGGGPLRWAGGGLGRTSGAAHGDELHPAARKSLNHVLAAAPRGSRERRRTQEEAIAHYSCQCQLSERGR